MTTIDFLTRTGKMCTPIRQEFILLSDVFGVSALVDSLNNPPIGNATESSVLGPFFTEDAPDGQTRSGPIPISAVSHAFPFSSRPQCRSESRSRRKGRASTCMSRVACSLRAASPFRARSSRRGRQMTRVSNFRSCVRSSADDRPPYVRALPPKVFTTPSTRNVLYQTAEVG